VTIQQLVIGTRCPYSLSIGNEQLSFLSSLSNQIHILLLLFVYRYDELLNEVLHFMTECKKSLMPPTMKQVLPQMALADCAHRSFLSKV